MTGAGTQADPYIVATLSDFFAMDDLESYYKLGADIDFADYEFTNTVTLKFLELDGDNHEIRNIYYPAGTPLGVGGCDYIKNVKFTNSSVNCLFYSSPMVGGITNFVSCVFTLTLGDKLIGNRAYHTYAGCTFNLSLPNCVRNNDRWICILNGYPTNCNIYVDVVLRGTPTTLDRDFLGYGQNYATNCTMFGKVKDETGSTGTLKIFCDRVIGVSCNLQIEGATSVSLGNPSEDNYTTSTCTINTDLIDEGTEIILRDNQYAITDEQAKSAGYLNSIGFTCYEGD